MIITTLLLAAIAITIGAGILIVLIVKCEWTPVILLPLIWYLPEQTSPGRLLEHFIVIRWLTIILVPIIVFILFIRISRSSKKFVPKSLFAPTLIFIVFSCISTLVNRVSILDSVAYLMIYLRYPLFFLVLTNIEIPKNAVYYFIRIFFLLLFMQVPEVIYRHYALGIKGDDISWSLGAWGTTNIGIYSIYAVCLIISYNLNIKWKWRNFIGILLLFIPAIFGEIKAFIMWVPIISLIVIFFTTFKSRITKFITLITLIVMIGGTSIIISSNWQKLYKINAITGFVQGVYTVLSPDGSKSEAYSLNRIGTFLQIWDGLGKNPINRWLGFGPGASLVGNFSGRPGRLQEYVVGIDTINQIGATLGDVGIIGTVLYYWILMTLLVSTMKNSRHNHDGYIRTIRGAFRGIWFFYAFIGPAYHTVWRFDASSFIIYFLGAVLYNSTASVPVTGNPEFPTRTD